MNVATNAVMIGTAAGADTAQMGARELAEVKRRITQLVDVDESLASDDAEGVSAAAAADTFNAEASDSRLLLAAAEHELRVFGAVCGALAAALRERAELRDTRRQEIVARYAPFVQ